MPPPVLLPKRLSISNSATATHPGSHFFVFPFVPDPPHRFDRRAARRFQFRADVFHMLGDGGIVRTAVIAEYRLVDLFLAEHLSRVSGQIFTDGVFAFRQRQRRITVVQRFGSQVEIKRTAPHAAGGYARRTRRVGTRASRRRCAATRARSSATRNGFVR